MTVTPEMIEAGRQASRASGYHHLAIHHDELAEVYGAMRAVDPKWVRVHDFIQWVEDTF